MSPTVNGLYLYGILPEPGPTTLTLGGLDGQPVQTQHVENFVFIYSSAQRERYRTSRQNLLTHEQVLESLMTQGHRVLLPLQFGLVVKDWDQVQQDLVLPYGEALHALFKDLAGMREVGVKIYWNLETELQTILQERPALQRERDALLGKTLSMDETIRVGQMIEAAITQEKTGITTHFDDSLAPFVQMTQVNDVMTKEMIYNRAFLLPWDSEPAFEAVIHQLDAHYGERLRIRYNNFTAPYNFAMLRPL